MKALGYVLLAAALLAAGAYLGRQSAPQHGPWEAYQQTPPPPPPGFVIDRPQLKPYAGDYTPTPQPVVGDNCPPGYMVKGTDCVQAPGYVVVQPNAVPQVDATASAIRDAQEQADFTAREQGFQARQQAQEAAYQQRQALEEVAHAIKDQGGNP